MSERLSIETAKAQGFQVNVANDYSIYLDIDSPVNTTDGEDNLVKVLPILRKHFGVLGVYVNRSKSGNKHIRMFLEKPLPVMIRIAIQAACGSDPKRELLNIHDILSGKSPNPNILFDVPGAQCVPWKHPSCDVPGFKGEVKVPTI